MVIGESRLIEVIGGSFNSIRWIYFIIIRIGIHSPSLDDMFRLIFMEINSSPRSETGWEYIYGIWGHAPNGIRYIAYFYDIIDP